MVQNPSTVRPDLIDLIGSDVTEFRPNRHLASDLYSGRILSAYRGSRSIAQTPSARRRIRHQPAFLALRNQGRLERIELLSFGGFWISRVVRFAAHPADLRDDRRFVR